MNISPDILAQARAADIVSVARMLGASEQVAVPERGVPCPGCGGHDRFSVDPGKNVFLCRASGEGGDPIDLVRHVHGSSFADAVAMLTGGTELPKAAPRREDRSAHYREKARRRAYDIWQAGKPVEPQRGGHLFAAYCRRRHIPFPGWPLRSLRETASLSYWEWSAATQTFRVVHAGPAILAAIVDGAGRFMGVHRTWLDLDRPKGKAVIADPETGEILDAKKVMGSQRGGRIVLRDGGDGVAIGEGIETTLSWAALHDFSGALWCGINLDNIAGKAAASVPHPSATLRDRLGRERRRRIPGPDPDPADTDCLMLPSGLREAILLGDSDSDRFTTQAAMTRACRRFGSVCAVRVDWAPDRKDWNDAMADAARTRLTKVA